MMYIYIYLIYVIANPSKDLMELSFWLYANKTASNVEKTEVALFRI